STSRSTRTSPPSTPPLSLHDALPISKPAQAQPSGRGARAPRTRPSAGQRRGGRRARRRARHPPATGTQRGSRLSLFAGRQKVKRSEEHTSELQSRGQIVCRLLPEKKT